MVCKSFFDYSSKNSSILGWQKAVYWPIATGAGLEISLSAVPFFLKKFAFNLDI